jgi:hypothetical protein
LYPVDGLTQPLTCTLDGAVFSDTLVVAITIAQAGKSSTSILTRDGAAERWLP